jgi:hypothetical protein
VIPDVVTTRAYPIKRLPSTESRPLCRVITNLFQIILVNLKLLLSWQFSRRNSEEGDGELHILETGEVGFWKLSARGGSLQK